MRKIIVAVLAALPLTVLAGPEARASGCCDLPGGCFTLRGGFRIKICGAGFLLPGFEPFPVHKHGHGGGHPGCGHPGCGHPGAGGYGAGGPAQLAPWYLYWPMEAHFQVPAPMGYPYWPSPMTPPPTWGYTPPPPAAHGYQQVGYYGYGAPSYWYGH